MLSIVWWELCGLASLGAHTITNAEMLDKAKCLCMYRKELLCEKVP